MYPRRRPRRAAILLIVLGCFVVAAGLLASLMRNAFLAQAQSNTRHYQTQALWLAESAVGRAASQLAADGEYRGETWTVSAAEFSVQYGGRVQIEVTPLEENSLWKIEVIADYPDHPERRVRERRQVVVSVPPATSTGQPASQAETNANPTSPSEES